MPATYTLDQLLACIAPFGVSGGGGLSASGSSASFGAMKEKLEMLTREGWSEEEKIAVLRY
jgi:hypothetical protein